MNWKVHGYNILLFFTPTPNRECQGQTNMKTPSYLNNFIPKYINHFFLRKSTGSFKYLRILARAIFWQCVLMCFTHPLLGGGEVWRDSSWSGKRRNSFCSCDLGISVLTFAVQTAETACLNPTQLFSYLRGRSQTTLTRFWPFLTTYLPIFDIGEWISLLLKGKIYILMTFLLPKVIL